MRAEYGLFWFVCAVIGAAFATSVYFAVGMATTTDLPLKAASFAVVLFDAFGILACWFWARLAWDLIR